MVRVMVFTSGLLLASVSLSAENSQWPGLPPDCWDESRNVHAGESVDLESATNPTITFSHVEQLMEGEKVYSPNSGYYFVTEGFRPDSTVHIFSEKDAVWSVTFEDNFYPARPSWINENLLFIRVYGGRIAFTDLILNVENETVIYTERGTDGYMAMQQFQEGCRTLGGCECIERE